MRLSVNDRLHPGHPLAHVQCTPEQAVTIAAAFRALGVYIVESAPACPSADVPAARPPAFSDGDSEDS
jgi:hypothetical protein